MVIPKCRITGFVRIAVAVGLLGWLTSNCCVRAGETTHVLTLNDGSICYGQPEANVHEGQFRFLVSGFHQAFDFPQDSIRTVRTYSQAESAKSNIADLWLFVLRDHQQLVGSIVEFDPQWLVIENPQIGTLKVAKESVLRIERAGRTGEPIRNMIQAADWKDPNAKPKTKNWRVDANQISSTTPGTRLTSNFGPPSKFEIRLNMRWSKKPNFRIGFGVDEKGFPVERQNMGIPAGQKTATIGLLKTFACLEVWGDELVLVRESDTQAAITSLGTIPTDGAAIVFLMDFKSGLAAVQMEDGAVHQVTIPSTMVPGKLKAVEIVNFGRSLTIDNFEAYKWSGDLPNESADPKGSIRLAGQSPQVGTIVGWDQPSSAWIVKYENRDEAVNVEAKNLLAGSVTLASTIPPSQPDSQADSNSENPSADGSSEVAQSSNPKAENGTSLPQLTLSLTDSTRLHGDLLVSNATDALRLQAKISNAAINVPITAIRSLSSSERSRDQVVSKEEGLMTAICGPTELKGQLLENTPADARTPLVWKPSLAVNASEFDYQRPGELRPTQKSGTVERTTPRAKPRTTDEPNLILQLFGAPVAPPANKAETEEPVVAKKAASEQGASIRFRTGDSAPANIVSVTAAGVRFESPRTTTTFAPDHTIDQIVFREVRRNVLSDDERARLLTVPRAQKDAPPTHLVVSTGGDFLRGHLMELSQREISIEVRGEVVKVPVEELAEIVWLYDRNWKTPRDLQAANVQEPADTRGPTLPIYLVYGEDQGVSIQPTKIAAGILHGTSTLLGSNQVQLSEVKVLYWGPDAGQKAKRSDTYSLSLAQMPRDVVSESDSSSSTLDKHPLVGQSAPEFSLRSLAGEKVELSKLNGRIVILDFWASWCGPCMQAMPQLDELVATFDKENVLLLAVNVQEPKNKIELALSRLKIAPQVLLDEEGEVANAYGANAIPQTVIVSKTGRVADVIVGGGNQALQRIRTAIQNEVDKTGEPN